jgi:hypothetical protein
MDVAAVGAVALLIVLFACGATGLSVLRRFLAGEYLVIDLSEHPAEDRR